MTKASRVTLRVSLIAVVAATLGACAAPVYNDRAQNLDYQIAPLFTHPLMK